MSPFRVPLSTPNNPNNPNKPTVGEVWVCGVEWCERCGCEREMPGGGYCAVYKAAGIIHWCLNRDITMRCSEL